MIFGLHGQALVIGIQRRSLRARPRISACRRSPGESRSAGGVRRVFAPQMLFSVLPEASAPAGSGVRSNCRLRFVLFQFGRSSPWTHSIPGLSTAFRGTFWGFSPGISTCIWPGRSLTLKARPAPIRSRKEFRHGHHGLEGPPDLRVDFDPGAHVCRGARRAHQLQPTPQRVPFAPEAAAVLPGMQSQRGALGGREGLRVRQRPVRPVQRRRTRQDRASLRAGHGNHRVRETRRDGSALFRRLLLHHAGRSRI